MENDTWLAPSPSGEQSPAGYISTGVIREPREGEWMRCLHPECASETHLHQAGPSGFPYPECEIFVAVGSSAPIFAIDAAGISAMLPAEGAPRAHITWEALDRWRAKVRSGGASRASNA